MENLDCKINVLNIQKYKKCNIQEKKDDGESLHDLVKHENTKTPDVVYICMFGCMKMHFLMLVLTLKKRSKVTIRAFIIKMWLFDFNVPTLWL